MRKFGLLTLAPLAIAATDAPTNPIEGRWYTKGNKAIVTIATGALQQPAIPDFAVQLCKPAFRSICRKREQQTISSICDSACFWQTRARGFIASQFL